MPPGRLQPMIDLLRFSTEELILVAVICFAAGVVRGFSGFALSALVMSVAVAILPPIELIPMLWFLEITASLLMIRGGWTDANRQVVIGLFVGSTIGVPFGIALTTSIPTESSAIIALVLILALATTQLANIRLSFLATKPGLYSAGFAAGVVTGLAGIGGMVVAVYVLSQNNPARTMRASLVLFLFLGSLTSLISFVLFGVMDTTATARGLTLAVPTAFGVLMGKAIFTPRWEPYYRPFCLALLIGLAAFALVRSATSMT